MVDTFIYPTKELGLLIRTDVEEPRGLGGVLLSQLELGAQLPAPPASEGERDAGAALTATTLAASGCGGYPEGHTPAGRTP